MLLACLLVAGGMAAQIKHIRIDNSHESYLRADDPTAMLYNTFRQQYGQDSYVLIAISTPEVFDLGFLKKLKAFHDELETGLPHVAEVTSLVNARLTRGENDTLIVEGLLEAWPEDEAGLAALKERVYGNPLLVGHLISRDGEISAIMVRPEVYAIDEEPFDEYSTFETLTNLEEDETQELSFVGVDEKSELVFALDEIVERYDAPDFRVHLSGGSVVGARLNYMMRADVTNYMIVCGSVILFLLVALFRRFSGVFIPLVMIITTLTTTFGCMVFLDIPFSMSVQMLPIIVMCVVVCNVIHVLVLVYQALADGKAKEDAIAFAYGHSGLAILMTSLTTAAGFAAFISADLAPIGHLGILSSMGVLLAFLYSVTLLPALIAILPMRQVAMKNAGTGQGFVPRFLLSTGNFATEKPWLVVSASVVILLWSLAGVSQVRFSHEPTRWFPVGHEVREALELIDSKLSGSQTIEVLVDTGKENGLYEPEVLERFELLMRYSESLHYRDLYVGKAVSISDVVKETHQALNNNQPEYYRIPEERSLVAQELVLFSNTGSDDLEIFTDSHFQVGRLSLRIPMVDSVQYAEFFSVLEEGMSRILGDELEYQITGIAPVFGRTFVGMIHSMGKSYMIAFAIITPLMILLVGDFRLGLISMIPNLLPVVAVLGIMGWFDLSLDVSTIVIGSILIGLAVDDTIHFFHRFQRYFAEGADVGESVAKTMETTGSALLITSLVLGSGFLSIGAMGTMLNTVTFGLLTAVGIGIAFFADILISPAVMKLIMRENNRSEVPKGLEVSSDTVA